MALADVNGDGAPDLAATRDLAGWMNITLNDGRGGFLVPQKVESDLDDFTAVTRVQLGDFDGDGTLDALVVSPSHQKPLNALLLRGSAGPRFEVSDAHDFGVEDLRMTGAGLGDFDGDGLEDFILLGDPIGPEAGSLWIGRNPGDGTFGAFQHIDLTDGSGDSPVVADFNGDGHSDLAIHEGEQASGDEVERRVTIFLNGGEGRLREHQRIVLWSGGDRGSSFGGLGAVDLDGDGHLDLVHASGVNRETGVLCLLRNDGSGAFGGVSCREIANSPREIVVEDFDGDGADDIAIQHVFHQEDSPYLTIHRGDGSGKLVEDQAYFDPDIDPRADLGSADFNGDGAPDLFFPIWEGNAVVIHLNDGRGGFDSRAMYADYGPQPPTSLAAADLDGDGRTDILTNATTSGSGHFRLLRNRACPCRADLDGDGNVAPADFFLYLDLFADADPRADFTGDGVVDATDFFAFLDAFAAGC